MTNQQLSIYRQNASQAFVPSVSIDPYELGRRDALDGLKCLPSAYFRSGDKRITAYNAGYDSIDSSYLLNELGQALQAFIGTPELDMLDAEAAEDRIAEEMWMQQQEVDEAQSGYTDWRI